MSLIFPHQAHVQFSHVASWFDLATLDEPAIWYPSLLTPLKTMAPGPGCTCFGVPSFFFPTADTVCRLCSQCGSNSMAKNKSSALYARWDVDPSVSADCERS